MAALAAGRADLVLVSKPIPVLALAALLLPPQDSYARLVLGRLPASRPPATCCSSWARSVSSSGWALFSSRTSPYIAAFWTAEKRLRPLAALPALLLGILVFPRLLPGLEKQQLLVPVALYTLALCTMFWRALARLERGAGAAVCGRGAGAPPPSRLSDSLLALERFAPGGAPVPDARYAILILYWLGQLGITLSAVRSFR